MPRVFSKYGPIDFTSCIDWSKQGNELVYNIFSATDCSHDLVIEDVVFENVEPKFIGTLSRISFRDCVFENCDMKSASFNECEFTNCKFKACNTEWLDLLGLGPKGKEPAILTPTNVEIAQTFKCKVYQLPNKSYVKVEWTCAFCHKKITEIFRRDKVVQRMNEVPFSDKKVCIDCYSTYRLRDKFPGCRTYGYHGDIHKYKTPLDRPNTVIVGLEMEFEGDFFGWKELQDVHQGMLHYGYDSSVVGQNELSWDCGSYSWWKYMAPLKQVCNVLGKYGGKAGDSAGIHIHTSRPDVSVVDITSKINAFGQTDIGGALFKAVSLRNNAERFEMYSNLACDMRAHHAGISYNSYDTCEFRLFNSTLDNRLILKHIKFCKEVFNAYADGKDLWSSFSKETNAHIMNCATEQLNKGFITEAEFKKIKKYIKGVK